MNRRAFIRNISVSAAAGLILRPASAAVKPVAAVNASSGLLADLSSHGDLRLPAWGPYTKTYAGISHVSDVERGMRFDLSVFPALYRRRQPVPAVTADTGFYPWNAAPDLSTYTLRHVLGELEAFYADATYSVHGDGRLIRVRFVNRTSLVQQTVLHFLAAINFPQRGPGHSPSLRAAEVTLPEKGVWIDATHYTEITFDESSPTRHLRDNAEIWGETRADNFVHGTALANGFGMQAGNRAVYSLPENFDPTGTMALVRFCLMHGECANLHSRGAYVGALALNGTSEFQIAEIPAGDLTARSFTIESEGGGDVEIDGFALVPVAGRGEVAFPAPSLDYRPKITRTDDANALTLGYSATPGCYGLAWEGDDSEVREWLTDQLDRDFPLYTHDHVRNLLDLGGQRHFTNIFVRPIFLAPGETKELRAWVCHAPTHEAAVDLLWRLRDDRKISTAPRAALPGHFGGRAYAYGVERLAATVATNIVFPVRRFGRFIRHYTPGRWWDSLYTWDSGFIGLGLLELDPARSVDNLAAYLTRAEDDSAFVHHGSPVPVQVYQLHALWNRTQDREVLRRFFPGVRRMHRFLVGRGDGSRTRTLASGLIRTWDYFYNSGGWDDYPPQRFVHDSKLAASVTPVVNSAHAIRTARLLRMMALELAEPTAEFDADIASLTMALQRYSWNPATGWFSYVRHDETGHFAGPLLHESGEDFNRGFDGIYPLVAGICTLEQEKLFLARLRDQRVFWTRCGLSTVDRSAPYFRKDGYWNGAVWMPHQWFFWKTLLDLGEADFAWQIAKTALETWENEVRATGCCFEHFVVETGRGAGWHHFGGLSSPLLSWYASYFRSGTLTGGLDCWVREQNFTDGALRAHLRLAGAMEKSPTILVVLGGEMRTVEARWNGVSVTANLRHPGTFEIQLPQGNTEGELTVFQARYENPFGWRR